MHPSRVHAKRGTQKSLLLGKRESNFHATLVSIAEKYKTAKFVENLAPFEARRL